MIFHQINQLASTTRSNQHYQQPTSTNLRLRDKNWIQEMNQGLRGDGAGEDVDGDCPLPMRGALVMTMAMISPSRREVSPAEQLHQSPRLVPPRFRLVAAEFRLRIWLLIFSHRKTSYRRRWSPEGHQGAHEVGGAPTLVDGGWPPSGISFAQYFLLIPKMTFVKFQDYWSCAEQVSNICSFSSPEFQLPAFSLFV